MKKFRVPSRRQPIFRIVKKILKITLWRNITCESLSGELPNQCILVSNHCGKMGPMAYELGLPIFNVKWGAHEMLGNYISRRKYLKDIFYYQKQNKSKFSASCKATFEAIFSKMIYKGMKIIGTYPDARLKETLKNSIQILEDDKAILIFPEDSNKGYFDVMTNFFSGFVMLSEQYYRKHQIDLPVYPVYYNHDIRKIVIGYPMYVHKMVQTGLNRNEIADKFKEEVNSLYFNHFQQLLK